MTKNAETEKALRAALLDLHRPWYEINGQRYDHLVYASASEVGEGHVCRTIRPDPCDPANDEHFVLACVECRSVTEDGEPGSLLWPCPTALLAGAAS